MRLLVLTILLSFSCSDKAMESGLDVGSADMPNAADLGADASDFLDMSESEDLSDLNSADLDPVDMDSGCWRPTLQSQLTHVQPMTGIALWESSWNSHAVKTQPGNVQLEFAYVLPGSVSTGPGTYDWTSLDNLLSRIEGKERQAIIRFRYAWPGRETGVPDWIKALPEYQETSGMSEGQLTWFPDWSSQALRDFHLDFFEAFAARYDKDPRIAFLQVGFGLWAEYHIYDGPNEIGQEFPSHAFQVTFLNHLEQVFEELLWSVSIDAGSSYYAPFSAQPALRELRFGVFDDSFMHQDHGDYNTRMWQFFDYSTRYQTAPHGGEFSYYTSFDQENVLNPGGIHGRTFESESERFHLSYIIGDGQPDHQTVARIREAGLATGYAFRVTGFETCAGRSLVEVTNEGVAPLYYDAYPSVGGVRSAQSLRGLLPGESRIFEVTSGVMEGSSAPVLTIESNRLVSGQVIEFLADLGP